jgi:hypothetical protein
MAVKRYNGTSWDVYAGGDSASKPIAHASSHEGGGADELKGRLAYNSQTSNYTLVLADEGVFRGVALNSSSALTVTVPPLGFPTGCQINLVHQGTGAVTVAGGSGVTIYAPKGLKSLGQGSVMTLLNISSNTWALFGSLTS